jgi:hypothetical protein
VRVVVRRARMPGRIARMILFVAQGRERWERPNDRSFPRKRESSLVPAFAGASGKTGMDKFMPTIPVRRAPDAGSVGWVERQRNPSLSRCWLGRGDGFHFVQLILRLPQRSHLNASRGRLGNIAVLSVQFVTVSTAPVFHARAARVERGE